MMNAATISSKAVNFQINLDARNINEELRVGAVVGLTYAFPLVAFWQLGCTMEWGLVGNGLASVEGALTAASVTLIAPVAAAVASQPASSRVKTALLLMTAAAGQIAGLALCG